MYEQQSRCIKQHRGCIAPVCKRRGEGLSKKEVAKPNKNRRNKHDFPFWDLDNFRLESLNVHFLFASILFPLYLKKVSILSKN